jgi:prolipoprotein diacylglyceryltransferase
VEVVWFWQGGLSAFGGAVGSWLGLSIYVLLARKPFWRLADALSLPSALFVLAGWTTCLLEGCAYGRRMVPGFLASETMDMFGAVVSRWPTQSAGVVLSLLAIVFLYWLAGRSLRPGVLAGTAQAWLGLSAFFLGLTRADPSMLIAGMRLDVAGGGLMAAAGAVIAVTRFLQRT